MVNDHPTVCEPTVRLTVVVAVVLGFVVIGVPVALLNIVEPSNDIEPETSDAEHTVTVYVPFAVTVNGNGFAGLAVVYVAPLFWSPQIPYEFKKSDQPVTVSDLNTFAVGYAVELINEPPPGPVT